MKKIQKLLEGTNLWLPVVATVLVGCYIYYSLRGIDPRNEVEALREAWNRQDFAAVSQAISQTELDAYGITREQFATVLKSYIDPILRGQSNYVRTEFNESSEGLNFVFVDATGKNRVGGMATLQKRHIVNPHWMTALLLSTSEAKYRKVPTRSIESTYTAFLKQATLDKAELEQLGIRGLVRTSVLEPWDKWAENCSSTLSRRAQSKKL